MKEWRLLGPEIQNAYFNMAIDEAVLTAKLRSTVPNTIRLFFWKPSAVSIGKFQNAQNEVQLENCRRQGVDVIRRITGGGAVYHDEQGEITYSVIADKQDLSANDMMDVYARIYSGIAESLRIMAISADFNEGNQRMCPNLTVRGRKISGSAQAHKRGVVLQHGTLLVQVDYDRMFRLLRASQSQTCLDIVSIAKDKITSISSELGRSVSMEHVSNALIKGFEKALDIHLRKGDLTPFERELSDKLANAKYSTEEWNLQGTIDEKRAIF